MSFFMGISIFCVMMYTLKQRKINYKYSTYPACSCSISFMSLFLYANSHFFVLWSTRYQVYARNDVLPYRTPAKLLISDETLGIPVNFNVLIVSDGIIPTPSRPYPKHGCRRMPAPMRSPCNVVKYSTVELFMLAFCVGASALPDW